MFGRTELNFNASKNKVTITTFPRTEKKIATLKRKGQEYQCLVGQGQNSDVWASKTRIPVFRMIR